MTALVKRNVLANAAGRAWMTAMSLAFVPVYINLLGIESYGIIGFYATLLVVFFVLDLGLSATLARETARRSARDDERDSMADVTRTLEIIYCGVGMVIGAAIILLAPLIAAQWLNASKLSVAVVERAIIFMGAATALQWPTGLYGGGLTGLQRQVELNIVNVVAATLRGAGAIAVLMLISTTLDGFFIWQIFVNLVVLVAMRQLLWHHLPQSAGRPRFRPDILRDLWRFAIGMSGISLITIVLMQADKVLLSTLLDLDDYAVYVLAASVASASVFLSSPISAAFYPLLTQLVASEKREELSETYHRACRLTALAVIPIVTIVAFFSREIIQTWTQDTELARRAAPVATLLAIGSGLNALAGIPYLLQLAHGHTRMTLIANSIAALALVPLVWLLAVRFGMVGAAWGWPLLNAAYLMFLIPLGHRKFLPGATRRFFLLDLGVPLAVVVLVALLGRLAFPSGLGIAAQFVLVGCIGVVGLGIACLAVPEGRNFLHRWTPRMPRTKTKVNEHAATPVHRHSDAQSSADGVHLRDVHPAERWS